MKIVGDEETKNEDSAFQKEQEQYKQYMYFKEERITRMKEKRASRCHTM